MASGARLPTWKERENNRRRERRRRAIASKIYSGLRMYGNYPLPKHCDNNEVLKALCNEAGWTVEDDGTTYRKGCKPPVERMDPASCMTSGGPSPPSFSNSASPSPGSSFGKNSLIPWLNHLSSASSMPPNHNFYMHSGSMSAPVTPPMSAPSSPSRIKPDWGYPTNEPAWAGHKFSYQPSSSTPPSPSHRSFPHSGATSPTFSLVASNPFTSGGDSRKWTPAQSGTWSPVVCGMSSQNADVQMTESHGGEFAFVGLFKAWEGETIHEECSDDLELTLGLGNLRTK
ncbi:hypothetical protein ACHQM5_004839 [Ranunculus cassubicifolius]